MDNPQLGRQVLDEFDKGNGVMKSWARQMPGECNMVACLGGWTMIKAGYTVKIQDPGIVGGPIWAVFTRPNGTTVPPMYYGDEAQMLLGMSDEEVMLDSPETADTAGGIWYNWDNGPDLFRKLVEESEGRQF